MSITYLEDENTLSKKCGFTIKSPIRLFDLSGLGIDKERFIADLGPTFADLPWDYYDVWRDQMRLVKDYYERGMNLGDFLLHKSNEEIKEMTDGLSNRMHKELESIQPYRRRTVANCIASYDTGYFSTGIYRVEGWIIKRNPAKAFSQNVGQNDIRSRERKFAEMSDFVFNHPEFQKLIAQVCNMVLSLHPHAYKLEISAHQVSLVARPNRWADGAPEGIHQDGADYIVSALEIAQAGARGAISYVYGPDRETKYLGIDLGAGQGIFQADKGSPLWHDVTPLFIDYKNASTEGYRNTFGFDINIKTERQES